MYRFFRDSKGESPLAALIAALHEYQRILPGSGHMSHLSPNEIEVLYALSTSSEPITAGEIATDLYISKSLVSRSVDHLMGQGLVETTHSQEDKRKILITISESGEQVAKHLSHYQKSFRTMLVEGIDKKNLETTMRVILQMTDNLNKSISQWREVEQALAEAGD